MPERHIATREHAVSTHQRRLHPQSITVRHVQYGEYTFPFAISCIQSDFNCAGSKPGQQLRQSGEPAVRRAAFSEAAAATPIYMENVTLS